MRAGGPRSSTPRVGVTRSASPTITVNAIIKVSATSLSTDYSNSLPAVDEMATVCLQYFQRSVPSFGAFCPHHDEAVSRQQFVLILLHVLAFDGQEVECVA